MSFSNFISKNKAYLILISILFVLLLILPWQGFYVLNDSYVYEWNVRNFFENGFQLHPLTSPTLLLQTFLGSIIYLVKKDPSLLRLLSSFFYFIGVYFLYKTIFYLTKDTKKSILFSLILMFNPLYLYLGFSFMSDIYFLSMFIASNYFFLLFLESKKRLNLLFAVVFSILAFLSRQTGIVISLVYLLSYIYFFRKSIKKSYLLILLIPFIIFISYQTFYPLPVAYTTQSIGLTFHKLLDISYLFEVFVRFLKTLYYIGFFTFPITFYYFFAEIAYPINLKRYSIFTFYFLLFTFISAYLWFSEKELMFYLPNILSYAGFNPQNLGSGIKQTIFVDSPVRIRAFYSLISIFSSSVFVYLVTKVKKDFSNKNLNLVPYLLTSLIILLLSLVFRDYFDRYLLVCLPIIFVFLSSKIASFQFRPVFLLAIPLMLFSLAYEYDYLTFNKNIWKTTKEIVSENKTVKSTFEYNAYVNIDKISTETNPDILFNRSTWLSHDYDYLLSYSDLEGYCRVNKFSFFSVLYENFQGYFYALVKCDKK